MGVGIQGGSSARLGVEHSLEKEVEGRVEERQIWWIFLEREGWGVANRMWKLVNLAGCSLVRWMNQKTPDVEAHDRRDAMWERDSRRGILKSWILACIALLYPYGRLSDQSL